jgi:FAD/FMN-containing dehydrogenase
MYRLKAASGRREFLILAGALGAGLAGGATPEPLILRSPAPADWAALRSKLSSHRLVRPGQVGYRTARELWDPRFDAMKPAGIAYCATPRDVSACLAFARRFGVRIATRSGGHSYAGWSSTPGLIIDVSLMAKVNVDVRARTARVGAGTLLIDLYNKVAAHGLAAVGGTCPTVGIAGLALGGGVGVVSRLFGLTCDNVLAVQIVTADGTVRECSESTNRDLFWACRGGGGGNFGVVTAFTLRVHPAPDLVVFGLRWPWAEAGAVVSAWQHWAPSAPDALWSDLQIRAVPGAAHPAVSVGGAFAGSVAQAKALLGNLDSAIGMSPTRTFIQSESYLDAMRSFAGCSALSTAQCHLPSQNPAGVLVRGPKYAKSDFFTTALPSAGITALLSGMEQMLSVAGARGGAGHVTLDALGGAINRVKPSATAFVHRNALFDAQYLTSWTAIKTSADDAGASTPAVKRQRAWLRSFYASMRPYASGQAYQNYVDPDLTNWQQAYYQGNYARLQQVKLRVDPKDVFRFPQSVRLPG